MKITDGSCNGASCCVTATSQYKLYFGSGTRLTVETSKFWHTAETRETDLKQTQRKIREEENKTKICWTTVEFTCQGLF